ncbi:XK-related protein 8 [Gastrophryne carolinensis]
MPSCLPPRYRFLDLVFALLGALAFLGDLGLDVWSAVSYYKAGEVVWAALQLAFYGLSSSVLQILSWGWFWVDHKKWLLPAHRDTENGSCTGQSDEKGKPRNGTEKADTAPFPQQPAGPHTEDQQQRGPEPHTDWKQEPAMPDADWKQEPAMPDTDWKQEPDTDWKQGCCCYQPANISSELFIADFSTSRFLLWPFCLNLLHLLNLGYPLRCLHSLEVGIAAYRNPEVSKYQDYAHYLTCDISMMRLVETFLENTPQLILVLYVIIRRETVYIFQYFSIAFSFICISWALLDYHQSLRISLKSKENLNFLASVIYFLWNFCLISARIVAITLFTVTFQCMIFLHFLFVWMSFFIWACLQKTEFMQNALLEFFYRATVASILYFSWFNIADGKTVYRCIIYHLFITTDSVILLLSWKYGKLPSSLDNYETLVICTFGLLTFIGLLIKPVYYKCVHPNVTEPAKMPFDEIDGVGQGGYRSFMPITEPWKQNSRMCQLAQQVYW